MTNRSSNKPSKVPSGGSSVTDVVEPKHPDWTRCLSVASFWEPTRLVRSAWLDHAPFAFWLIDALRPRLFVELGTHQGFSYCAFCQAIERLQVGARCYAVDTWRGDEHSGFYDEQVLDELRNYHDPAYGSFSQLLRLTFDEAAANFNDASIDLLHVDGRHFYEDVRHDFETWRSKLSDRAIVLFHDTNVRDRGFGVFKLWQELSTQHPSFEFVHGYGLGVLAVGSIVPQPLGTLFSLSSSPSERDKLRIAYSQLGARLRTIYGLKADEIDKRTHFEKLEAAQLDLMRAVNERDALLSLRDDEIKKQASGIQDRDEAIRRRDDQIQQLQGQVAEQIAARSDREQSLIHRDAELHRQATAICERDADVQRRDQHIHRLETHLHDQATTLAERLQELIQRNSAIQQQIADIQERDARILREEDRSRQLQAQLTAIRAELAECTHALAQRNLKVLELEAVLKRQMSDIETLNALAEDHHKQVGQLESQVAEATSALTSISAQLQTEQAASEQLRQSLVERELTLQQTRLAHTDTEQQLAHASNIIANIRQSTSWRLTAPLRSRLVQSFYRPLRRLPAIISGTAQSHSLTDAFTVENTQPPPTNVVAPALPTAVPSASSRRRTHILFVSGEAHTPGHYYRVERYAAAAAAARATVRIATVAEACETPSMVDDIDLLIIWRAEWSSALNEVFNVARKHGTSIVFDVDDLMFDSSLATVEVIDAIRTMHLDATQVGSFYDRICMTFERSDYGSAPTAFLAHRMRGYQKPTFVLPNGFDQDTLHVSRAAVRSRRASTSDGLERIGYAAGSRTHQRDFKQAVPAISRILRERPNVRLVLFQHESEPVVFAHEFKEFEGLQDQIEWRTMVALQDLPRELARFDVNIAPLEVDNPFCEAKSELKYFEAALVNVPTIASPTEPFRSCIIDGTTGMLAHTPDDWYAAIVFLLENPEQRQKLAQSALHHVLWQYGPERRVRLMDSLITQTCGDASAAAARFAFDATRRDNVIDRLPHIPEHQVLYQRDNLDNALVTIVIPLYNYAEYVLDALNSVHEQTLERLDLVVVDDCSTDGSFDVVRDWLMTHGDRFNRVVLAKNDSNCGLAFTRNVGFSHAETPFVLPLDADNRLLPHCAARCLAIVDNSDAAFVYPLIKEFGSRDGLMGDYEYRPVQFIGGNYIDAMALVRKAAWAAVGGYDHIRFGWEDFDFWCKLVELGLWGEQIPEVLALYRVHDRSMLNTQTNQPENREQLKKDMRRRHPWLRPTG